MFDALRRPVADYQLAIAGTMHYPNCPYSIDHFRRIMGQDADVADGFRSELAKSISDANKRGMRQGDAAGRVALHLMNLHLEENLEVSLTKACHLTAQDVACLKIDVDQPYRPSNPDRIRQAFYDRKNACHLWAAAVARQKVFVKIGEDDAALREFLGLAAIFGAVLDGLFLANSKQGKWEPWLVPNEFCDERIRLHVPKENEWLRGKLANLGNTFRGGY